MSRCFSLFDVSALSAGSERCLGGGWRKAPRKEGGFFDSGINDSYTCCRPQVSNSAEYLYLAHNSNIDI